MIKITYVLKEDKKNDSTNVEKRLPKDLSKATENEKIMLANVMNVFDKALINLGKNLTK